MRIAIGSDHAGFAYKEELKTLLAELGHEVEDFGTHSEEPVDYPDFIIPVAEAVARGQCQLGIVLGGSGIGEAIAANKVPGIRAALAHDTYSARMSREHNDANVLSIGQRIIGIEVAKEVVRTWLSSSFSGDQRHRRRLAKIRELEESLRLGAHHKK